MRLTLAQAKRFGIKLTGLLPTAACRRACSSSMPDDLLWAAVSPTYPEAVREYPHAVPGRRFRLDIALPTPKLAIEVDGWQHHGKFRKAHQSDRERQNLLVQNGWRVLRFTAGQIHKDMPAVLATIAATLKAPTDAPISPHSRRTEEPS